LPASSGSTWGHPTFARRDHQNCRSPCCKTTIGPSQVLVESNFLQNLEGELDTAHVSFLHATLNDDSASLNTLIRVEGYNNDRHPRLSIIDTDYGFLYGGRRTKPNGEYYWRVTQYLLRSTASFPLGRLPRGATIWVPIDDYTCWRFLIGGVAEAHAPDGRTLGPTPLADRARYLHVPGRHRHRHDALKGQQVQPYGMDRQKQRTVNYTGMTAIPTQDQAMNEGMERSSTARANISRQPTSQSSECAR